MAIIKNPIIVNKGVEPTGNINITSTSQVDVTNYATAQVVDSDLVAGNIKKDVNILGITGTYEGSSGNLYQYYDANNGENVLTGIVYARGIISITNSGGTAIKTFDIKPQLDGDPVMFKCDNLPDNYKFTVYLRGDIAGYYMTSCNENTGGNSYFGQYKTSRQTVQQNSSNYQKVIMLCIEDAEW